MSAIPSTGSSGNDLQGGITSALSKVDTDAFLKLMIQELSNQDPLDPTDSAEFLQQITQIREIGASDRLSSTLQTVLEGQNLATASGLIGKNVVALSDQGQQVEGTVDRVSVDVNDNLGNRSLKLHVGDTTVSLKNIRQINETASSS